MTQDTGPSAAAVIFDALLLIVLAVLTVSATVDALRRPPELWRRAGLGTDRGTFRGLVLCAVPLVFVCGFGVLLAALYWLRFRPRLVRAERGETLGGWVPFIPGQRAFEQAVESVDRQVEQGLARGGSEFSITLNQNDLGVLNRLDTFTESEVSRLQRDPRLHIIGVNFATPYLVTIRVGTNR